LANVSRVILVITLSLSGNYPTSRSFKIPDLVIEDDCSGYAEFQGTIETISGQIRLGNPSGIHSIENAKRGHTAH
jgi:hypothetical protein